MSCRIAASVSSSSSISQPRIRASSRAMWRTRRLWRSIAPPVSPVAVRSHSSASRVAGDARMARLAARMAPTLTEPLRTREELRAIVDDEQTWEDVFERPLSEALERELESDAERGVVLTDAVIGTFAAADDPSLRQN